MSVNVEIVNICYGCLSSDRNIAPLGELSDIFYNILKPQTFIYGNVLLCWECRSILKKTWRLQQRIFQSQILSQSHEFILNYSTSCLSTLQSKVIENCEIVPKDYKENAEQRKVAIKRKFSKSDEDTSDDQTKNQIEVENTNKEVNQEVEIEIIDDKKKGIAAPKKYRFEKLDLSSKFGNVEDFYIKTNVSLNILKEIIDRRLSMRLTCKQRHICKICKINFHLAIDLRRHETLQHLPSKGPYRCCECDVKYTGRSKTLAELDQHLTTHSVYKCRLCADVFQSETQVDRHLKVVHRFQYRCLECTETFFIYREMINHYRKMHTQFACDQCRKTCKSKKAIESHIKFKHLPLPCDICGRLLSSGTALDSHKRLHHPKEPYTNTELSYCVECNLQFSSVYKYKKHLYDAAAHKRVSLKISCPDCDKTFSSKQAKNNHYKLIHLKKTKYFCEICKKYFIKPYQLRKHRERIHES